MCMSVIAYTCMSAIAYIYFSVIAFVFDNIYVLALPYDCALFRMWESVIAEMCVCYRICVFYRIPGTTITAFISVCHRMSVYL